MTLSRRALVPASDLPVYLAAGWLLVYRCAGGWRVEGEAAVVEWVAGA